MPEQRLWQARWALLAIGGLIVALLLWNPSVSQHDALQSRASWAPGALSPSCALSQTFTVRHDGLTAIEVLIARYQPAEPLPDGFQLCLRLEDLDADSAPLVESCQNTPQLAHNQTVEWRFAEQRVGQAPLRATFWATAPADVTLWATAEQSYSDGTLTYNDVGTSGDLYLSLEYRYRVTDALLDLWRLAQEWAGPLACLALLLGGPGTALALLLTPRSWPRYVAPMALAFWPLALLWSTSAALPYTRLLLWLLAAGSSLCALLILLGKRSIRSRLSARLADRHLWLLAAILLLSLTMRMLNVRHLVAPAWVDSLHHTEIVQLIIENGAVPSDGGRFVPVQGFFYHFGFHATAAALAEMAGIPAYRAVLILGQVLIALAPLAVYGLARELGQSRPSSLLGAVLVGCWSYMPPYYASWGRYTQLAGLLVLPGAMTATWRLAHAPAHTWRERALAGVLVSGLLLTHYRVSALFLPWMGLMLVCILHAKSWRALGGALLAAIVATLLLSPWLWRLATFFVPQFGNQYGTLVSASDEVDAWQASLLAYRWTPYLLGCGGLALVWAVVRRRWPLLALGVWSGLCILLPNLHWLGLPDLWLVNNVSVVISFWLPTGVLAGSFLADSGATLWATIARRLNAGLRNVAEVAQPAVLIAAALLGSWLHLDVVNRGTILVERGDLSAAAWIRDHLPEDALILINTTHWSNTARRGTDGGWWLQLLSDRRVTMPSLLYIQSDKDDYDRFNDLAMTVENTENLCDGAFLDRLRSEGVTHLYVGSRGGPLIPSRLDACSAYAQLYQHGPVRVYELSSSSYRSR